jgi:hypothetical protein
MQINGSTYGDLIFGTRNTIGNADVPITRMRITSNGSVVISNTAFDTLNVASGGILANTVLINQRYDQGTGILQANGSVSVAGNTITQNFHVQGNNNLILQSQALATTWFKEAATVITNNTTDVTDPLGGSTATKIVGSGGSAYVAQNLGVLSPLVYTFSVYLRTLSGTVSTRIITYLSGPPYTSIGSATVNVTSTWQRFTFTTITAASAGYNFQFDLFGTNTIYAWGVQGELGYIASPYTPTTTAAITNTNNLYVPSGNVVVGNTSTYSTTNNAITVAGSIGAANSIYVGNRVGYANANNISVVYQSYNSSTNSLDVVFG